MGRGASVPVRRARGPRHRRARAPPRPRGPWWWCACRWCAEVGAEVAGKPDAMRQKLSRPSALRKSADLVSMRAAPGCAAQPESVPDVHTSSSPHEDAMNKSELIQHVADEAELSRSKAATIVDMIFD